MAATDEINRVFREFRRYTADGLPDAPTGAPLPVGDPQSGVHNPSKAELRTAFTGALDETVEALEDAETARDLAIAAADTASAVGGSAVPNYGTQALAAAATIPAARTYVLTAGYAATGDGGGALYKRVTAQPTHQGRFRSVDRFLPNGTTDATNGGWWEIAEQYPHAKQFGAKGDGTTNDATALQNLLDYGASTGSPPSTRPFYMPNFTARIGDGTFNIATGLTLPAGVSIEMESGTRIVATAAMTAIIQTNESTSTDQHNNTFIRGGTLDCNDLADIAIWPKYFAKFTISDLQTYNALDYHILLGSTTAPASSYEAIISNVLCRRDLNAYPTDLKGIRFHNCGDSHISDTVIMGVKYGIVGPMHDSKLDRVHVWNATEHGDLYVGFYIEGVDNILSQCQVDAPIVATGSAYTVMTQRNTLLGCGVNHFGNDSVVAAVYLDAAGSATIIGCTFKGASGAARLSTDVSGTPANATIIGNHYSNLLSNVVSSAAGFTAFTGTTNKATAYATGSVTLVQLAERVAAIQAALTARGIVDP